MQDHLLFVNILTCLVVTFANTSHSLQTAHGMGAAEKATGQDMTSHMEREPSLNTAAQTAPSTVAMNLTSAAGLNLEAVTAIGPTHAPAPGADLMSVTVEASKRNSKTPSTSAAVDSVLVLLVPLLAVLQAKSLAASRIASETWSWVHL